jgi:hypothetical protein
MLDAQKRALMNDTQASRVRNKLSVARLAPYQHACGGGVAAALALYAWNIEVSSAFHGPLGVLEVSLRNAIDQVMRSYVGTSEWWRSGRCTLNPAEYDKLALAHQTLSQLGRPAVPGDMIAALPFSFWTNLVSRKYEMDLWRPALHRAFRQFRGPRRSLHDDLNHLRKFRNRIAHHEPIHQRHLEADLASILRILGYLSADMAGWVRDNERVSDVLLRRPDVCSGRLPTRF